MMTVEEKTNLKNNAERVIKDPKATPDDKAEAEIILKQIGKIKREYNRRSPEEIAAERERFKTLYAIEDLIYGGSVDEAMKLADSLGEITLYSMDGKHWHDNPDKVAEAGGEKYTNILRKAQQILSNPKKMWDGIPPSIKTITLPYWEFYKRSGKAKINGVQMYRLGSNVKEIVKDTEEYWNLYNTEYFESGGVEPQWVDKYSGMRPETVSRLMKDPAEVELRKRARKTGESFPKTPLKKKHIVTQTSVKPTLADVDVDITNRISFPEILADIRDKYIGFAGPTTMGFTQFDEMRQSGQGVAPPPMRRRRSTSDFGIRIEKPKEIRKGMGRGPTLAAVDFNKKLDEVIAADRVGSFVASLGGPQEVKPPQTLLTPEVLVLRDISKNCLD